MAKIIKIDDLSVSVGLDDGGLRVFDRNQLNFEPKLGDEVDIFEGDGQVVVTRRRTSGNPFATVDGPVNGQKVNQLAYVLFAILLGTFGIHEFYAGKVGLGILCILFCWTGIPSLVGLIKGILALTRKADDDGNILI